MILAGHPMQDCGAGLVCECGMTWRRLLDNRHRWIKGELGLAHYDAVTVGLSDGEIASLEEYAKEYEEWIYAVTMGRAKEVANEI